MKPILRARVALAFAAVIPWPFVAVSQAHACLFSNVASAYADGLAARRVTALPPSTARGEALWAPFAFRQQFAWGQALRLREDMREVARSMGASIFHARVRWLFGDGAQAAGTSVAHTYRRRGVYKIEVQSYYDGSRGRKGWYDFDMIDVAIGPIPAGITWMGATRQG